MPTSYVIRDDARYRVLVGWDDDLETFYARVYTRLGHDAPMHEVGTHEREIRAVSVLADAVLGFATVDAETVTALRHDASRMTA